MKGRSARLIAYSAAHFFVDFACALLLFSSGRAGGLGVFLLYNYCAFALQLPLGILADRLDKNAGLAALGCGLVASAFTLPAAPLALAIVAGVGNALFHVGGGVDVLGDSGRKASALGIFVSPGALGLFAGSALAGVFPGVCAVLLLALCAGAILFVARLYGRLRRSGNAALCLRGVLGPRRRPAALLAVAGLVLVVVLRSYVGLAVQMPWQAADGWSFAAVLAVVLGKCAGGFAADRFGARRAGPASLLAAGALFLLGENPLAGTAALFLFNMTMPMTLSALARLLPGAKGLAFGLTTFALFLGFLPVGLNLAPAAGLWTAAALCAVSAALLLPSLRACCPCASGCRSVLADLPRRLLLSLALTLLLEGAFARLCRVRGRRNACLVLLVNLLTNPPVALVGNLFPLWPVHLALEAAAVLVEGAVYARLAEGLRRPLLFSLGANAFSYLTGAALSALLSALS